ncbi:MAG: hypothetical protein KatS3mg099_406 [Candidatus Parcubacteria bacterium]|nr:MAG: hypothetical protein KatS3mg099_406 [Candidatus Parcubacteria bacterium]
MIPPFPHAAPFSRPATQGFILAYTLVIGAVLLSVGMTAAAMFLGTQKLTHASRYSLQANYAAESAAECVLYWRLTKAEEESPTIPGECFSKIFTLHSSGTQTIKGMTLPDSGCASVEHNADTRTISTRGVAPCGGSAELERGFAIFY